MSRSAIFTPKLDERVMRLGSISEDSASFCALALELGVSLRTVINRKSLIRSRERAKKMREHPAPTRVDRGAPSPFARPAWFDEDLTQLTKGAL